MRRLLRNAVRDNSKSIEDCLLSPSIRFGALLDLTGERVRALARSRCTKIEFQKQTQQACACVCMCVCTGQLVGSRAVVLISVFSRALAHSLTEQIKRPKQQLARTNYAICSQFSWVLIFGHGRCRRRRRFQSRRR